MGLLRWTILIIANKYIWPPNGCHPSRSLHTHYAAAFIWQTALSFSYKTATSLHELLILADAVADFVQACQASLELFQWHGMKAETNAHARTNSLIQTAAAAC